MEYNNKSLITINTSLAKIEKQIAIGEKILSLGLANSDRNEIIKYLLAHENFTVNLISGCYPLKNYQLEKYKDQLNWGHIEFNSNTNWTVEFLEKFGSQLNWESAHFLENKDIVWSIELVYVVMQKFKYGFNGMLLRNIKLPWVEIMRKYKKAVSWEILNYWSLPMPEEIIELYKEKLDWKKTSRISAVATHPWSVEFMEKYSNKWDWYDLSNNRSLPWSVQLMEKFVDKWDWHRLSYNTSILWTSDFIEKHKERWFWPALSGNSSLPWSEEFIEKFIEKWCWADLSENNALPWTQELVEKYDEKWHWARLSRNTNLPLTENLILKYNQKWYFDDLFKNKSFPSRTAFIIKFLEGRRYSKNLYNRNFPWSIELFEFFKEKMMFDEISYHNGIAFSMEIIDRYPDFWNWSGLSSNESIIWTDHLIEKYKEKWNWGLLSKNKNFPWSFKLFEKYSNMFLIDTPLFFSYDFIYEKIFKEHLNDKVVDEIINTMQNKSDNKKNKGKFKNGISNGIVSHKNSKEKKYIVEHPNGKPLESNNISTIKKEPKIIGDGYYLFFDTETTGLPRNFKASITDLDNWPRLVQLAYLLFDKNGNKIAAGDFIIKPNGFTIPIDSSRIHGISNERAISEGISLFKVLLDFNSVIEKATYLIAHNISFDEKIVGAEFLRNEMKNSLDSKNKICTMVKSTNFCAIEGPYGYKWPSLSELHYKLFDIDFEEAHNASVDITATAKCFWKLKKLNVL